MLTQAYQTIGGRFQGLLLDDFLGRDNSVVVPHVVQRPSTQVTVVTT